MDGDLDGSPGLTLPPALKYKREIFVTYLDEEVMVVRDENGGPEILLRKGFGDAADGAQPAWGFNEEPDTFDLSDVGTDVPPPPNGDDEELPAAD